MSLTNTGAPWPVVHFGAIAEFKNGLNFRSEETGCEVKILGVGDFQTKTTLTDTDTLETIQIDKELDDSYYLRKGDLVFVRSNGNKALVGRCLLILSDDALITFSGFTIRARIKSREVLPEYISLLMQFGLLRNTLKREGRGTNISNLNQGILSNLQIPLPSVPEQKAIVDLLSTWDEAIEKTEQLIQAKERRFQYLIRTLINDPNYPRCHIRDFTSECTIRNRQAQCERVLSVTNTNGFVLPEEQFKRRVASSDLSNYKLVTRGQYAYNPSRINVGSIARLDNWDKGVLSPMYIVFELDQSKVNSDFFMHWLTSHEARQRIRNSAQGSVRETVSFTDLGAIVFPVPDMERQSQAAEILNYARSEIDLLKNLADEYKAQKRGLMQKLLTGQWRVKEEAAA